jgi:hypothetical protein
MKSPVVIFVSLLCAVFLMNVQGQKNKRPHPGPAATTVASGWTRPEHVTVDETNVYWVSGEKKLIRMPKSGGAPVVIFETTGETDINGVAVDETGTYILTSDRLLKLAADGGTPKEIAQTRSKSFALGLDENNIYWIGDTPKNKKFRLSKADKKGGEPVALSAEVFAPQSGGLAVDQTRVYWLDYADDLLRSVSKDGGDPATLIKFPGAQAIAVDEKYVYCGGVSGRIVKLDKNGGAPQTLIPENPQQVTLLAMDDTNLYYSGLDRIMKVSKNGGPVIIVARKPEGSFKFTVDDCCLYWSDYRTGRVMKIDK